MEILCLQGCHDSLLMLTKGMQHSKLLSMFVLFWHLIRVFSMTFWYYIFHLSTPVAFIVLDILLKTFLQNYLNVANSLVVYTCQLSLPRTYHTFLQKYFNVANSLVLYTCYYCVLCSLYFNIENVFYNQAFLSLSLCEEKWPDLYEILSSFPYYPFFRLVKSCEGKIFLRIRIIDF